MAEWRINRRHMPPRFLAHQERMLFNNQPRIPSQNVISQLPSAIWSANRIATIDHIGK